MYSDKDCQMSAHAKKQAFYFADKSSKSREEERVQGASSYRVRFYHSSFCWIDVIILSLKVTVGNHKVKGV